jgi:hypothetical protein
VLAVALSVDLARIGIVVSYLLLLAFVISNLRHLAVLLLGLGLAMNFVVILANGGFMPITVETVVRSGYPERIAGIQLGETVPFSLNVLLEQSATDLWLLSDIFSVRSPLVHAFSIGDIIIATAVVLLLVQVILGSLAGKQVPIAGPDFPEGDTRRGRRSVRHRY